MLGPEALHDGEERLNVLIREIGELLNEDLSSGHGDELTAFRPPSSVSSHGNALRLRALDRKPQGGRRASTTSPEQGFTRKGWRLCQTAPSCASLTC